MIYHNCVIPERVIDQYFFQGDRNYLARFIPEEFICPVCGTELHEGDEICPGCKRKVLWEIKLD